MAGLTSSSVEAFLPLGLRPLDQQSKGHGKRRQHFTSEWRRESVRAARKAVKFEHILTPHTKTNSKWPQDFSVRHDTIKLLEENTGKTYSDINFTNVFLGQSPWTIEIKAKINSWNLIKLVSFCTAKETINKVKRQPRD